MSARAFVPPPLPPDPAINIARLVGRLGVAERIVALFRRDRARIGDSSDRAGSALRVHEVFQRKPCASAAMLAADTKLSQPTVNAALIDLERIGIVQEITGRRRGRVFAYRDYMTILDEGTAPLPDG